MDRKLSSESLVDMKFMTNDSGFTSKYFYSLISRGTFPPPIKFGRTSRWYLRDYTNWKEKAYRNR